MIGTLWAVAYGVCGAVFALGIYGALVKKRALASADRKIARIKKSRLAIQESVELQRLELRSVAATAAAVKIRGAPERLLGLNPAIGTENWDVNVTQIQATARCAAAAMAYYEADLTLRNPEIGGLRFAQWWYGLEDDTPCHERLNPDWHAARMAPTLLERTER